MTHSTKSITATILLTIVFSTNSFAQEMYAGTSVKTSHATNTATMEENDDTKTTASTNPVIAAKFSVLFPGATNLRLIANNADTWVSFINNGRKAKASFTAKGKMNYAITECAMEQLPEAFSQTIKKEYTSYHLFNAIEIIAYNTVAYQAVVENAQGYITLKYTADGIEEIQRVTKVAN